MCREGEAVWEEEELCLSIHKESKLCRISELKAGLEVEDVRYKNNGCHCQFEDNHWYQGIKSFSLF